MTDYPKRGEIYLVNLPSKPKDVKNRPALVVSLDIRNKFANDIIVIPYVYKLKTLSYPCFTSRGRRWFVKGIYG